MTAQERQRAIDEARAIATAAANGIIAQAARPGATEAERVRAETAAILLKIAERKAATVPLQEAERWKGDLRKFLEYRADQIAKTAAAEHLQGRNILTSGPVLEAVGASLAALDAKQDAFREWIDNCKLTAWLAACHELAAWDRPLGALLNVGTGPHGAN